MKRVVLLMACGLIASAGSVAVHGHQSDPLSGGWTGKVVADGNDSGGRLNLVFNLIFEGSRVTGTAGPTADNQNGTVATGTFDRANGALKLEVDVKDGSSIGRAVFDGRLLEGTALGRFIFNNRLGTFLLTKDGAAAPATPQAGSMDAATALKQGFAEVSGWLLKAAEMVPPDKYSYRPIATVRTYGELLGHVADGYNYFCGRAAGQKIEWSDAIAKGNTDKATITAQLKTATDSCSAAHTGKGAGSPLLLQNFGHTNLHYGNVITYMRMLGLLPPSS